MFLEEKKSPVVISIFSECMLGQSMIQDFPNKIPCMCNIYIHSFVSYEVKVILPRKKMANLKMHSSILLQYQIVQAKTQNTFYGIIRTF